MLKYKREFNVWGRTNEADEYIRSLLKQANDLLGSKPNSALYTNLVKLRLHNRQKVANAYYMLALANMAKGNSSEAKGYIGKLLKIEPSHFFARYFDLFTRVN